MYLCILYYFTSKQIVYNPKPHSIMICTNSSYPIFSNNLVCNPYNMILHVTMLSVVTRCYRESPHFINSHRGCIDRVNTEPQSCQVTSVMLMTNTSNSMFVMRIIVIMFDYELVLT